MSKLEKILLRFLEGATLLLFIVMALRYAKCGTFSYWSLLVLILNSVWIFLRERKII